MSKVCPYLIEERRQRITCKGLEVGMTIGQGFSSSLDLREYQQQYCYGDYSLCPLAQAVDLTWGVIACPHNHAVDCQHHESCDRCGWNPAVSEERLANIKQRLYEQYLNGEGTAYGEQE